MGEPTITKVEHIYNHLAFRYRVVYQLRDSKAPFVVHSYEDLIKHGGAIY